MPTKADYLWSSALVAPIPRWPIDLSNQRYDKRLAPGDHHDRWSVAGQCAALALVAYRRMVK
jgi:hypothetical protein